jgi:hypothetical protein
MIKSKSKMKMKTKPHYLMMALIVAVVTVATWSCNKDDDPSLAELREDKLQYLQDSLRISDSLRLTNNAGVVNYAITIVDGSTSSMFANDETRGRKKETASALAGAIVTISQYGKTQKDTTDASGMVVFAGFFRSAVNISIERTDFTKVSYVAAVGIQDSTRTGTISFVGNLIPIFPLTGTSTARIQGRATIQTDLTNKTRELVPDGTTVSASIDATNGSDFQYKFLTNDIDDVFFISACGCQFAYVGHILQASYQTGAIGTVTGGNYSLTVPAAIDGLPMVLEYSDIAANQSLYESNGVTNNRTNTYRNIFQAFGTFATAIPAASSVTLTFETNTTAATANAVISSTIGTLDRINVTNAGAGYSGTPVVEITGGGGTGAAATATVANGRVTGITLTNPGSGYTSAPSVALFDGNSAAAASVTNLSQDGTVTAVVISNSGSGYVAAPTVTFSAPTGTGLVAPVTATGTANISNGRVTSVTITNAGAAYVGPPTVTFSAAPAGGVTAAATGFYSGQSISDVQITNSGARYSFAPAVTFGLPNVATGVRAEGNAVINPVTRQVTGITITNPGMGYTAAPTVTLAAYSSAAAAADVFLTGGAVLSADITSNGSGYASAPAVVFSGGGGTGAAGTAVMVDGKVVGINITSGGSGYTSAPTIVLQSGDGAEGFATVTNGVVTAITITDGGRNYTGAPRLVLGSSVGGGATATTTVAGGAVTGATVVTGGTGYLEGNTPSGAETFSDTKFGSVDTKPGLTYINDIHYGTGVRQPN